MPFKANQDRRHRVPKPRHRVTNWAVYNAGLRARGSLTVWSTAEAIEAWRAEPRTGRGGHRQANAALHRVVVVRMRAHQPTIAYVRRRTAEGKTKREIIRCLKRFVAREIFGYPCPASRAASSMQITA